MIGQPACVLKNIQDCGVQLPRPSCPGIAPYARLLLVLYLPLLTGEPMSKARESFAGSLLTFAVNFGSSLLVLDSLLSGVWPSLGDNPL